jgi:DNA-binding CsgD family transcriptional regulator
MPKLSRTWDKSASSAAEAAPAPQSAADAVLTALYEGVFEQPYWKSFLEHLRQTTHADYASMIFRRRDANRGEANTLRSGFPFESFDADRLHEVLKTARLPYQTLEEGRVYGLDEIVDATKPSHLAYKAYLADQSLNHLFVVRTTEPEGGTAWLAIGRSGSDFADGVRDLLSAIAPHLKIAARTLASFERERMRADIAAEAVRRLNFGWVSFDIRGAVVEMDSQAERLFRTTPGLGYLRRGAPLRLEAPTHRLFLSTLEAFNKAPHTRPRAFHLLDDPWLDMLTVPIRYRAVSRGVTPVAAGYVHGAGGPRADRCDQLTALFRLTPSEARLAVALTEGKSLAEAATELGLTVETARNYSKKIYAKTATRGQADLVRLILASVIALS